MTRSHLDRRAPEPRAEIRSGPIEIIKWMAGMLSSSVANEFAPTQVRSARV